MPKASTAEKEKDPALFQEPGVESALVPATPEEALSRVNQEEEVERQVQARTKSLMERAGMDPVAIERELTNREKILERARETTIRRSQPHDWTLFRTEAGDIGVPRDSLLVNAKKVFSISIFNYRPKGPNGAEPLLERTTDVVLERDRQSGLMVPKKDAGGHEIPIYTATMWADAICGLTGEPLPDNRFVARTGRFAGTDAYTSDLAQSCRTGLDALIVRKAAGLRKVSAEELVRCNIDISKCYKGSGFGSADGRRAEKVAEGGVAEAAEALWNDILKRVGGEANTATDLLGDCGSFPDSKDPKKMVKWPKEWKQITKMSQVERIRERLSKHSVFGDAAQGKAGNGRQPGDDE